MKKRKKIKNGIYSFKCKACGGTVIVGDGISQWEETLQGKAKISPCEKCGRTHHMTGEVAFSPEKEEVFLLDGMMIIPISVRDGSDIPAYTQV